MNPDSLASPDIAAPSAEAKAGLPAGRLYVLNFQAIITKVIAFVRRDTFLPLLLARTFFSGVFWAAVIPLWPAPGKEDKSS